jgi:hypothetical protein
VPDELACICLLTRPLTSVPSLDRGKVIEPSSPPRNSCSRVSEHWELSDEP